MKAKKLVSLALPIMLVAGIGVGCTKDKAEENETDRLKAADEKIDKKYEEASKVKTDEKYRDSSKANAEKEYISKLNSLMGDFTKQATELNQILVSDKPIVEKRKEFDEKKEVFTKTNDKIIALDPGDKYKEVHNMIKDAMYEATKGALMVNSGLNLKSEDLVRDGGEMMTKSSNLLFEADKKMKELVK
ncbi:hypothetical protein CN680_23935 [Bacillus pseudomycoides]|uniref:hypothetical protein n=1 Tax=Bacillus pseudomycoides TaxID=64104 RepID=UPI000BEE0155|nr:hypothetical protein [Bacillus pseudomycoides]PED70603.1 hypothetical protein CON97_18580 [Bacillus pseudomycoides]PEI43030.1 hypothetical protein CN620_07990 [Bacillus pseudomycoides]PEJ70873.1 hypothetical protein CN680_23935 [Bacillus pseudomycoides]PEM16718.1 hypothetical protein CN628_12575 [Bacillus pseudomycoides]PEP04410.1 hypothetical protein CN550_00465 [Bacillus pseudomycoides]